MQRSSFLACALEVNKKNLTLKHEFSADLIESTSGKPLINQSIFINLRFRHVVSAIELHLGPRDRSQSSKHRPGDR